MAKKERDKPATTLPNSKEINDKVALYTLDKKGVPHTEISELTGLSYGEVLRTLREILEAENNGNTGILDYLNVSASELTDILREAKNADAVEIAGKQFVDFGDGEDDVGCVQLSAGCTYIAKTMRGSGGKENRLKRNFEQTAFVLVNRIRRVGFQEMDPYALRSLASALCELQGAFFGKNVSVDVGKTKGSGFEALLKD